ncbi:hypothetical protein EDM00_08395 [Ornithobacterium rhinotracheale]|uniref:hypothetical protein n=1 Tax=Ornithobacterium rhinotracheale TaxID=28251 RepID=UPI00129C8630|nr:hypothetical protein [Ornithobacterium rhinotracheale]MRI64005.1 hypothetical protein [Ornithobacterium rhinotracheale]
METPYEYHNEQLGVKVKYLISDKKKCHKDSLKLISYITLYKRLQSATCTEKSLRRASLGCDALVSFNSLDGVWRELIVQRFGQAPREVAKGYFAKHFEMDGEARAVYLAHRFGDEKNSRLDLEVVSLYTAQASVLNTITKVKTNRKAYIKAIGNVKVNIWESLSRDVNNFTEVEHSLPTTPDSLRYKYTQYKKKGYKALISGKFQNKNASRTKENEQMAFLDELIAKHTNLNNETIAEVYNATAKLVSWKPISAGTVANRKKEKDLVTYAGRKGIKQLENNVLMQNKRRPPSASMLYWSIDGWDVELLYQKTTINKEGNRVTSYNERLNIVVILDAFNKYPIGYAIGTHETPVLIEKAMKNAINHTRELFGKYYKAYQIQTDNYAKKKLTPMYQTCSKYYTPAKVGNAKSKVVEPYFKFLNEKYCKLYDNWSGHNISSGSKNQPNVEFLNKIKHQMPDEKGCIKQITAIMEMERQKKVDEYVHSFEMQGEDKKLPMSWEEYMLAFGSTTGYTNRLQGSGLNVTIAGQVHHYDCFDLAFRKQRDTQWKIYFDKEDLSRVLAVSPCTKYRYELEEKYIQPMCIADQKEEDHKQLKRVNDFNENARQLIIEERKQNAEILTDFFEENPSLDNTLGKLLLTNSLGQHKDERNRSKYLERAKALELKDERKKEKHALKKAREEQIAYYESKININDFL